MFGIGGQELILLMLIGLIVLGPERLPRIANQIGGWLGQARRMTRVMKRQLEEELDLNQPQTIKPPATAREPSYKPPATPTADSPADSDLVLPRDDDEYSPLHGEGEVGTGVGDDQHYTEEDVAAADAEREAVADAAREAVADAEASPAPAGETDEPAKKEAS
jgi:sec-independent protein translocase protein TatB